MFAIKILYPASKSLEMDQCSLICNHMTPAIHLGFTVNSSTKLHTNPNFAVCEGFATIGMVSYHSFSMVSYKSKISFDVVWIFFFFIGGMHSLSFLIDRIVDQ